VGRSNLYSISGRRHDHHLDTETKNHAANVELGKMVCSRDNDGTGDNDPGAHEHTLATTEPVGNNGTKGSRGDGTTANRIHEIEPPKQGVRERTYTV
jgi:hypothetical protein